MVELVGVGKYYDNGLVHALDGIDLAVAQGECVAVTGPSGCGKSTMLHLLAALDRPTFGTIRIQGTELQRREPAEYRRTVVGLVFQLHNLLPQLTARQNVEIAMFGTHRGAKQRQTRAERLLADVDLAGRELRPPTRLSGGERQRVAIARALANDPLLLLADEPTGNLDQASVDRILSLFASLRNARRDLTMIIVTHDSRVAETADRIVYMRDGRVAVPDTPMTSLPR